MSTKPDSYEELTRLVSALLDGLLSIEESARLQSLLESDPAARSVYMQMIDQEIELSCLIGSSDAESRVRFLATLPSRQPAARRRWPAFAAAAVVLLAAALLALLMPPGWRSSRSSSIPRQFTVPDTWAEDFENGALSQWFGRLQRANLPAGSKYAIATAVREYPPVGPHYVIQLPADWSQGLFTLTTNSTLHVTYFLGTPGNVNVFMHTLPSNKEFGRYSMFQLFSGQFPGPRGEWRTASIPFSRFVRKVPGPGGGMEFVGGSPEAGERVTTLAFSSLEEIDFVIDRIWITP